MKKIILLLSILALCSCGTYEGNSDSKSFSYDLQGVWEATNRSADSAARMEIDYNRITIIGAIAHFKNTPRDIPLEAYSGKDAEDSIIYIKIRNEWQPTVEYSFWHAGTKPMLTLIGNGFEEEHFKLKDE